MRVTVLGVGNTLMSDEGFGPEVVRLVAEALATRDPAALGVPEGVEVRTVDGGVLGLKLLPYFQDSDVVLVVDAMDAGARPGSLFRFTPEEAELEAARPVSAHEIALPHIIQMAALAGSTVRVIVIGCQVADMATYRMDLTAEVRQAVPDAVELVFGEIARTRAAD